MTGNRVRALVLVALLVLSATLTGSAAAQAEPGEPAAPADAVYVTEDGDAILVYTPEQRPSSANLTYDVDVDSGLVYGQVTDPSAASETVDARLNATATTRSVVADGSASVPSPSLLSAFDLDITSRTNAERAATDATLTASLTDQAGLARFVESARTSGRVTSSASSLRATGRFDADLAVPLPQERTVRFQLTETDDVYTIAVADRRPLRRAEVADWRNRSAARETIASQYAPFARSYGGDADITLDSYSLTNDSGRPTLDVEYTVVYREIESGLQDQIRTSLSRSGVNESQTERLVTSLSDVTINNVSVRYEATGRSVSGRATVDVSGYDRLLLAYLGVAQSLSGAAPSGEGAVAPDFDRIRAQFQAQQAADLEQTQTWSGSLTTTDAGGADIQFEYHTDATNWQAYVAELEARDIPVFDSEFTLSGTLADERLSVDGAVSVRGEGLFEQLPTGVEQAAQARPGMSGASGATDELVAALGRSGFQKGRLNLTYGAGGFVAEFGGAFSNFSAVRDRIAAQEGAPPFGSVVGRTADGETTTYVRVSDAVSGEVTEDAVRSLPYVGERTEINLPGEWDREFPRADTDRAEAYLGDIPGQAGGVASPGFGVLAAVVALVTLTVLARRSGRD